MTPPPVHFSKFHFIEVGLAKRWVVYSVLLSLALLIGGLGFVGVKNRQLEAERDSALAMVSTKAAPIVVTAKTPVPEKSKPAPGASVAATPPNTDARVVLIDSVDGSSVFDPGKVIALKDEVTSAVAGCIGDAGRAFELCVKLVSANRKASPSRPAASYLQYAALIMSKAGLVQAEAERIVPCFTGKLGKKAVVVEASKYKSAECQ